MTKLRNIPPTRKTRRGTKAPDNGGVYDGTVGWEDGLDHFDLERSGVPLVKVTLFRGHNPVTEGENKTPARAKGRKILARFDPKSSDIPDDGEHVIVAVPAGRSKISGASFIIGRANPDPKFIPNRKPTEKIIFGPNNTFIRMKSDGSIYLFTRDVNNDATGKTVSLQVKPDGFVLEHPHMRITAGPNGYHAVHSSGARIDFGSLAGLPAPLDGLASMLTLSAAMVKLEGSAIEIGPDGVVADNLMKATPTLAAFAATATMYGLLVTALAAISVDLAAALGGSATAPATITPLGASLGALIATLGGLPAAAPTQSATVY